MVSTLQHHLNVSAASQVLHVITVVAIRPTVFVRNFGHQPHSPLATFGALFRGHMN